MFAWGYVRSVLAWGRSLLHRAFAHDGEDLAPGLLSDFSRTLEDRVAEDPDRYRRDYIGVPIIYRKAGAPARVSGT